jgi:hypothetical protein
VEGERHDLRTDDGTVSGDMSEDFPNQLELALYVQETAELLREIRDLLKRGVDLKEEQMHGGKSPSYHIHGDCYTPCACSAKPSPAEARSRAKYCRAPSKDDIAKFHGEDIDRVVDGRYCCMNLNNHMGKCCIHRDPEPK